MKAVSAKRSLVLGFSLSLVLLLVSSAASYKAINALLDTLSWVQHTSQVENSFSTIVSLMKDVETGQRGYLLTGRDRFLEPYETGKDSVWNYITRAKKLTEDNAQQQKTFDTLKLLIQNKLLLVNSTIETKKAGLEVEVDRLEHGKIIMDSIRAVIKTMIGREQQLMVARSNRFSKVSAYTPFILIASSVISLLIAIFFYRRIRKDYQEKLALEKELVAKNESISRKVGVIENIAKNIAAGNYDVRVKPEDLE